MKKDGNYNYRQNEAFLLKLWPPQCDVCLDLKGKLIELVIYHREYELVEEVNSFP